MTALEKLKAAFDDIGIKYYVLVSENSDYRYLFLGKRVTQPRYPEGVELERLLMTKSFFEFTPDERVASY